MDKPYFRPMRKFFIYLFVLIASPLFEGCKEDVKKTENTAYAKTGDKAIDELSLLIVKDPLNPDLRYKRALRLYDKSMLDECIEDMRIAITADSLKPEYYHLVSDAFLDNNLSSKALQSMEKVAALYPERIPTLLKLAETQYILKQYDPAINTCNNILKIDRQNAEAYFMLGSILKDMGETKRAINAFQTATEMNAKLTDAWIALGNIFAEKKDKAAEKFYNNALSIDPKNINSLHAMAYYLQESNKVDEAIGMYEQILAIDPAYKDAYLNAGILQLEKRNLDKAYEYFNIMVGVDPKDWAGYHYRGAVNMEKGNFKDAQADFQSSLNLNNENTKANELIAYCKKKQGL